MRAFVVALAIAMSFAGPLPVYAAGGVSPGLLELTTLEEHCRPWHAVLLVQRHGEWSPVDQWLAPSEAEARAEVQKQQRVRAGRFIVEPAIGVRIADALVIYESGGHPWIIGVNSQPHRSFTFATKAEAVAKAKELMAAGYTDLDLGLHQLNTQHLHGWLDVDAAFDPCTNVTQGGLIWAENYARCVATYGPGSECVELATRAYNSGNFNASQGYAHDVYGIAASLPAEIGSSFPVVAMTNVIKGVR